MRSRLPWVCGSAVFVVSIAACAPSPQRVAGRPTPVMSVPVRHRAAVDHDAGVDINCHGGADKVTITLDRWKVQAQPGDVITFTVKGSPHKENLIQVTPKRPELAWPLDALSYTAKPGAPAKATVRPGAVNGTYGYNISFRCVGGPTGEEISGLIDPDIIISGGTTKDTTQAPIQH